jgi:putative aldouronate transport system substrate-binding protein
MKKLFSNRRFFLNTCAMALLVAAHATAGGSSAPASSSASSAAPGPLGKYTSPLTLTWGISSSSVQQFKQGDTYENNIWSRKYLQDLGINLKVDFTADGTSGAYEQRLNLAMASGDLPDVIRDMPYRIFREAVDAGLVADITDVYEQYADDWMKTIRQKYSSSFEYASVNGRLYGIPGLNDNRQFASLLWIRDDWLKNLGLKAPTTIDELIAVARAFTLNDPDGNGKNDTYGLGLHNGLVSNNFAHLCGFFSAFGVPSYTHNMYYRGADGKVTYAYLEPRTKDALKVLQDMYKEGIIDPEFNVKDANKLADDIASGKVGMAYGLQYGTWWPWNGLWTASNVLAHPYPIPTQPGITPVIGYESNQSGALTVITSKSKNPEALIKLYNLYNETVNPYMSDETYAIYDADEQWRFSPAVINEPQETNYQPMLQPALEKKSPAGLATNLINRYKQISDFSSGVNTSADAYGLWGQYSLEGSMYVIMNNYVPKGWLKESILAAEWPQILITNYSSLQTITEQAFTEIIMGTQNINAYDTFVQNWLRAGGQQTLTEMDRLYPAK